MDPNLILQLANVFVPIIGKLFRDRHAATGELPTDDDIRATLAENIRSGLAEGEAWKAAHPNA